MSRPTISEKLFERYCSDAGSLAGTAGGAMLKPSLLKVKAIG